MRGGLKLVDEGSQSDQVCHPEVRASGGNDQERVLGLDARPARRQGGNIAEAVAIEEEVVTPMNPPFDAIDLLSEQGVKGMGDPDRRSHFSGAACSSSIGRKLFS